MSPPTRATMTVGERLYVLEGQVRDLAEKDVPRLERKVEGVQRVMVGLLVTIAGSSIAALLTVLIGLGRL